MHLTRLELSIQLSFPPIPALPKAPRKFLQFGPKIPSLCFTQHELGYYVSTRLLLLFLARIPTKPSMGIREFIGLGSILLSLCVLIYGTLMT